ncbi:hypothetical protein F4777DRAFT_400022 [Nemania sp. FL0916]|nr:hypothetical protein F4777DRAFT_400022 [Nemania sp. FL0916]
MFFPKYRIYVQFGQDRCVRLLVPGVGSVAGIGLSLFDWLRHPNNISRLRDGLQHVYEKDKKDLMPFVQSALRRDPHLRAEWMDNFQSVPDMLVDLKKKYKQFDLLLTGVEKLEFLSNATRMTVIPSVRPRTTSGKYEWLYLINLDQNTLEVYNFENHRALQLQPLARLEVKSIYKKFPRKPPGYYIKLKMSEFQNMLHKEWLRLHMAHEAYLGSLWRQNAKVLQTIPHADNIPFTALFGGVFYRRAEDRMDGQEPKELTKERLAEIVADLNARRKSTIPIFKTQRKKRRLKEFKRAIQLGWK